MKAQSLEEAHAVVQSSPHPIDSYHQQFKVATWQSRTLLELLVDFENFS